jgi:sterol desaturase/sphingolipid hydroxylase (fatty acid hydroxylase superfamily)
MFVSNGIPVVAADRALGWGVAPGMLVMFSLYFVLTEEIHWRFHLGGWLPRWLQAARERHYVHHERPDGSFNIFLPVFDRLVGSAKDPRLLK